MNAFAEYRRLLIDAGLSAEDADRVVRLRSAKRPGQTGSIRLEKKGDELELLIYDVIGFDFFGEGITPKKLTDQIKEAGPVSRISVRINSPGGSVFDAITILNILRRQEAKVTVDVDGV